MGSVYQFVNYGRVDSTVLFMDLVQVRLCILERLGTLIGVHVGMGRPPYALYLGYESCFFHGV